MYDIEHLRQTEFPLSAHHIYFNHASISPLPIRTRDKVQQVIAELSRQPMAFFRNEGMEMMETFKGELAAFINARSGQEIVSVTTTSTGLNAVAQAISWQPGDNLLFCDVEFPSNAYPWLSLERDGVEVRQVPAQNGGLTLAALEPMVDFNTRLVTVSAVQFFTGHRADLMAIGAFCRDHDILFVVDAIQAIGHMKIDVQAMNIDVLASGGQKSILALPGTGFLYVRDAIAETLNPRHIGGNATENFLHWLDYDLTFAPGAQRFNSGTPNLAGIASVVSSLGLIQELGVEHIDKHTSHLVDFAIDALTDSGYQVITPRDAHGPIVTFKIGLSDEEAENLVAQLAERNVSVVKHLDAPGNTHIRASFHCYNTESEVTRFVEILKEIGD